MAAAMFPQPNKTQSEIQAREAQAAANMALAAERDQNTRGKTIRNDRYEAMPTELAQLFLSGGQFHDEFERNPNWQAPGGSSPFDPKDNPMIDWGSMRLGDP
ncbi:hypothetical protein RZS08_53660, partial [Arthrospira platensis SPKY1]|nr:hypothetical protein [Arthrospira platensis SPKY1]